MTNEDELENDGKASWEKIEDLDEKWKEDYRKTKHMHEKMSLKELFEKMEDRQVCFRSYIADVGDDLHARWEVEEEILQFFSSGIPSELKKNLSARKKEEIRALLGIFYSFSEHIEVHGAILQRLQKKVADLEK